METHQPLKSDSNILERKQEASFDMWIPVLGFPISAWGTLSCMEHELQIQMPCWQPNEKKLAQAVRPRQASTITPGMKQLAFSFCPPLWGISTWWLGITVATFSLFFHHGARSLLSAWTPQLAGGKDNRNVALKRNVEILMPSLQQKEEKKLSSLFSQIHPPPENYFQNERQGAALC